MSGDRRVVDPFPSGDLAFEELPEDVLMLRALLGVLADTGVAVRFPVALAPGFLVLRIAEGFRMHVESEMDGDGSHLRVWATWVDRSDLFPPGCAAGGGPVGDGVIV